MSRDDGPHVVFLFEMAWRRAKQLEHEGLWGEDLYLNASAPLYAYEQLLDAEIAKTEIAT